MIANNVNGESFIIINNVKIEIPEYVKRKSRNSQTVIGNKVYVNGYEYTNGKWKRSLVAIFHMIF